MRYGWLWLLCVTGLTGCGGEPLGEVQGRVTLNGQPITQGSVVFENLEAGISVNAPLDANGRFEVRTYEQAGLPPGTYQVAVSPRGFQEEHEAIAVDPDAHAANSPMIPTKYHLPATSGLTFEVQAGANDFDLKLD